MNPFVSVVNQRKAYAELLLQQANAMAGQMHLQQALLQSVVFQLRNAYRFYLGEIAVAYQCKNAEGIGDLWTLIANLQLLGKNPAETREMHDLNQRPETWLSELQACFDSLSALPERLNRQTPTDENRIPAFSSAQRHDWSTLELSQVARWLSEFNGMVERHRESMVEW